MSDIAMSVTMDEKDVQRALQNMVKENAKLRAEIGMGVQESKAAAAQEREWQKLREKATKDATAQMQQLNNAAQRIKDSVATPFEEAKKKAAELREHLQAGRITVDEYRKAYAAVGKEMKEASRDHAAEAEAAKAATAAKAEASKKAAEAEREHSQAVREATAIADKYATKEERVAAELKRLNTLKEKGVLSSKDYARAVEAEQKKLSETGDAADKSGGLIGGLTTKMGGFVSGLASGAAVISVLKAEYDALIERQGKSKDANITLAVEQEKLLDNLGDADPKQLFAAIKQTSADTSIKEANVTAAVNEAMAARGDLALEDVLAGVNTAGKVSKFSPGDLAGLSAAAIDTKKQTGLDMDQSMGFLRQMLPQSRVKSLKGVAENFTPAVGGLMQQGADRSTAAALLASMSHGMGDVTGQQTRTASLSLGGQLRAFAPGQDMGQTIAMLQQDKEQRDKFLSKASFEVAARPAVESLLSGGKQAEQFAAARTAFQEDPRKALERGIAARGASQAIALAETDQRMGNAADQFKLNDKPGAMSAIMRDRLREIRDSMGKTTISSNLDTVINDLTNGGMQTEGSAVKSLEGLKAGLRPSKQRIFDQMQREEKYNFNDAGDRERFNATAKERYGKTAEGKQEAVLQALIDEIKANKQQNVPGDNAARGVIPAVEGERAQPVLAPGADLPKRGPAESQQKSPEPIQPRGIIPADERTQLASKPSAEPPERATPTGIIPADERRKPVAPKPTERNEPKTEDAVGTMAAGTVKPPKRAPSVAEQEYADAVQDLQRNGTSRARRDRVQNAEQTLAVEMPPEYKTAMEHQTAVLERIAAQTQSNSHAGRVAARAEGRP